MAANTEETRVAEDHLPKFTLVTYSRSEKNDSLEQEQTDIVAFEVHEIEGEELQEVGNEDEGGEQQQIELRKVHNAFSAFALVACPECDTSTCLRPVQECCGHVKCRPCFIANEDCCRQCVDHAVVETMEQNDEGCEELHPVGNKKLDQLDVLEYSYNIRTEGGDIETIVPSANEYILELEQASGGKSIALVSSETLKQLESTSAESQSHISVDIGTDYVTPLVLEGQEKQRRGKSKKLSKPKVSDHIITSSSDERKYHCTKCNQEFSRKKYHHQFHMYCNPINGKRPFSCKYCDKEFVSCSHYEYHVMSKHTNEKPFRCEICSNQFYTKKKLERHMNSHNSTPHVIRSKFYLCAYCKKRFNNLSNCKKHLRTHTDEKPYKCDTCQKCFRQKGSLDVHIQNHIGNRPHKCPEPGCGLAFFAKKDCKRHHFCHTNHKPFKCTTCYQEFRRKDNLERHLRTKHGLEEDVVKFFSNRAAEIYYNSLNQNNNSDTNSLSLDDPLQTMSTEMDTLVITGLEA
ncbi:unnamed protein product [Orchesella dallaii]|uniref:C2H2-type domain-containing protein n=1 Tax=Orchesella dallaii TaxID=48710 RepID=A0ABP1QEX3_9HEXA